VNNRPATKFIDKLGWVYIQDKKVLMARSYNKTTFYIPGGKREIGESDREALTREIKEELSVDLINDSIISLGEFHGQADGKPADVMVKIHCFTADFIGEVKASAEIEEVSWLTHADCHLCSEAAVKVLSELKERNLID
jgi:8-oxo-dGTP diphosphatase